MCIMQEVRGQIYVGAFFFCLDDFYIFLLLSRGHNQRHFDVMCKEVTQMNGHYSKCPKGSQE